MTVLADAVAFVTGASRGIGKGIAIALGEAGATVFLTGRTTGSTSITSPTIDATAAEITRRGGRAIGLRCDHADDAQVEGAFERVRAEYGRLDLLVNSVTALPRPDEPGPGKTMWDLHPFWEIPIAYWDAIHRVGLRSHYVASVFAAPLLIANGHGLIVNISSVGARRYLDNVPYGVGKAGVDKLSSDMGEELRPFDIASVSLWPPLTATEDALRYLDVNDRAQAASPLFTGRAVVALASDPDVMARTGGLFKVIDLAQEYGFADPAHA